MSPWPRRFFYGLLFVTPVGLLGSRHWRGENELFVPGRTSDGHHQIESQCANCHDPFGGAQDEACLACHGQSLKARNDSHAPSKFDDPARSAQLAVVDARSCVACHREHRAEARLRGSVSVPTTFCIGCHAEVRQERPSHTEFSDSGCASAGCHNYHDNRALYRDFLAKDRGAPRLRADPRVPTRTAFDGQAAAPPPPPLPAPDLPATFNPDPGGENGSDSRWASNILPAITEWSQSAHAQAGVNCSGCHQRGPGNNCRRRGGRHRLRQLPPRPASRIPRRQARHAPQRRGRPHVPGHGPGAHESGGVEPHARLHLLSWGPSLRPDPGRGVRLRGLPQRRAHPQLPRLGPLHRLAQGAAAAGPRRHRGLLRHLPPAPLRPARAPARSARPGQGIRVEHNQNGNLRPNDRMWREVCIHCHSAGFSLAALVDPGLVMGNFTGEPSPALTSMDLIEKEKPDAKR